MSATSDRNRSTDNDRLAAEAKPRLLDRRAACRYLSIASMDKVPVAPLRLGRRLRWDRIKLDRWLDEQAGIRTEHADPAEAALEAWLREDRSW